MRANRPTTRWPIVPLGTLAEFRNGINFSKANFGRGIKVIGVGDFQSNVKASYDCLEQINPSGIVRKEHLLKNGDILFVRSNGNRELIGRNMFVERLSEDVTHSAFSIRVRFTSDACHPQFYAYLFRSQLIRQALSLHGGGTNISNLNQDILGRLEVPLPSKRVQCRVASILSAYDNLIENNTRRITVLEQTAQTIYREWFVSFRFPGHKHQRVSGLSTPTIPAGWKDGQISDLARISRGGITPEHFGDETFLHFSIPAFDQDCVPLAERGSTIKSNKYIVPPGCILLSKLNPRIRRIWVPGEIDESRRAIASTEFLVLIPKLEGGFGYIHQLLCSNDFQDEFISLALGTSTSHQRVKPDDFLQMPITLPPAHLICRFSDLADPMMRLTENLRKQNFNLRQTRDLLLPKLTSGEINVEEVQTEAIGQGV
jgi:type I restriction enzyme S subunit